MSENIYLIYPWETYVWEERILPALSYKIQDYGDVDKIIGHILGDRLAEKIYVRDAFHNMMVNYHMSDTNADKFTLQSQKVQKYTKFHIKNSILPSIQNLAKSLPQFLGKYPLKVLMSGNTDSVKLTRIQVAALIAGSFFGVFDAYEHYDSNKVDSSLFQRFSLLNVFKKCHMFSFECLLNYFNTISQRTDFSGDIVVRRKVLPVIPKWDELDHDLGAVRLLQPNTNHNYSSSHFTLGECTAQVTGAAWEGGNGQEEILFNTYPELMVVRLLCNKLEPTEAIAVMGAERFSEFRGVGSVTKYAGEFADQYKRLSDGTIGRTIVLIDPTPNIGNYTEFTTEFDKDLNKAFCGLSIMHPGRLPKGFQIEFAATPWGSSNIPDVVESNKYMKFIQLYIASSLLGICLNYYPGDDPEFLTYGIKFMNFIKSRHWSVNDLYVAYKKVAEDIRRDVTNGYNDIKIKNYNIFNAILEAAV